MRTTLPPCHQSLIAVMRAPIRTDLLPVHDHWFAVHPRERQLPFPGQPGVVAEVSRVLQLADEHIHDLDLCIDLNQTAEGIPVPPIEALDIGIEQLAVGDRAPPARAPRAAREAWRDPDAAPP